MDKAEMLALTRDFALDVLKLVGVLPNCQECWVLGKQLLRSGTSIGANYREAQRSRTKEELYSKIHICLQEAEETLYWLELLRASKLGPDSALADLMQRCDRLIGLFVGIAKTAQANKKNKT